MAYFYIFFAALAIFHCASTASHCSSDIQSFGVSVSSSKNDSGQSTYLLSARTDHSITMDVQRNITKCDGRRVIRIRASIRKGRDQFCRKEEIENGRGDCTEGCGGGDKIKAEEEINGTGNGRKLQLEANSTDKDDCTIYREKNCEGDSRILQRDIQARVVLGAANRQTEGTDVAAFEWMLECG